MARQTTFCDIENASRRRTTKRDEFLCRMDAAIPWAALVELVKPYYFSGKRGRKPIGIERMLRMYFLQLWFNLSDEGVEDAVYDSRAFSEFMGVSFGLGDRCPTQPRCSSSGVSSSRGGWPKRCSTASTPSSRPME